MFASTDTDDIVTEWQIWGPVLGLPLLIGDTDGTMREAFARIGQPWIAVPTWRRRRRSAIARRRPSRLFRRPAGRADIASVIHRGEHEIIGGNWFCFLTTDRGNTRRRTLRQSVTN